MCMVHSTRWCRACGPVWLDQIQKREEPEKWDSLVVSMERYLDAWAQLDRDTVRKAWVDAVPKLGAMPDEVRRSRGRP